MVYMHVLQHFAHVFPALAGHGWKSKVAPLQLKTNRSSISCQWIFLRYCFNIDHMLLPATPGAIKMVEFHASKLAGHWKKNKEGGKWHLNHHPQGQCRPRHQIHPCNAPPGHRSSWIKGGSYQEIAEIYLQGFNQSSLLYSDESIWTVLLDHGHMMFVQLILGQYHHLHGSHGTSSVFGPFKSK